MGEENLCLKCKNYDRKQKFCKQYEIPISENHGKLQGILNGCEGFESGAEQFTEPEKKVIKKKIKYTKTNKHITIGKHKISIGKVPKEFEHLVPKDIVYIENEKRMKKVWMAIVKNKSIALEGHTGIGKTEMVRHIAQLLNAPFIFVQFNGARIPDSILGYPQPLDGKLVWWDGILPHYIRQAKKYPNSYFVFCLDEWNAASKSIQLSTRSLFDKRKNLQLDDENHEVLILPKNILIFATMNPAEHTHLYGGIEMLNQADKSRLVWIKMGFPDKKEEYKILKTHFPKIKKALIERLILFAQKMRYALGEGKINLVIGTRSLLNALNLLDVGLKSALELSILDKLSKESKVTAYEILEAVYGKEFMESE